MFAMSSRCSRLSFGIVLTTRLAQNVLSSGHCSLKATALRESASSIVLQLSGISIAKVNPLISNTGFELENEDASSPLFELHPAITRQMNNRKDTNLHG